MAIGIWQQPWQKKHSHCIEKPTVALSLKRQGAGTAANQFLQETEESGVSRKLKS